LPVKFLFVPSQHGDDFVPIHRHKLTEGSDCINRHPIDRLLSVIEHDSLCRAHIIERLEALLAAVAGTLEAAEGKLDAAAGAIAIDEDLAGANALGDAMLARAVLRPGLGDEAVVGGIG